MKESKHIKHIIVFMAIVSILFFVVKAKEIKLTLKEPLGKNCSLIRIFPRLVVNPVPPVMGQK